MLTSKVWFSLLLFHLQDYQIAQNWCNKDLKKPQDSVWGKESIPVKVNHNTRVHPKDWLELTNLENMFYFFPQIPLKSLILFQFIFLPIKYLTHFQQKLPGIIIFFWTELTQFGKINLQTIPKLIRSTACTLNTLRIIFQKSININLNPCKNIETFMNLTFSAQL